MYLLVVVLAATEVLPKGVTPCSEGKVRGSAIMLQCPLSSPCRPSLTERMNAVDGALIKGERKLSSLD
jgi:hypothetical protein